jgi:hypothetical protein
MRIPQGMRLLTREDETRVTPLQPFGDLNRHYNIKSAYQICERSSTQ